MAHVAGHDINYISIAGALGAIARKGERPLFPLNLVGDYGGGGMLLAFGVVCGAARGARVRRGPGRRRRDGRRRRAADDADPRPARGAARGRTSPARTSSTPARTSTRSTRPPTAATSPSARSSRSSTPSCSAARARAPEDSRSATCERWPEFKERFAAIFETRTRAEWAELLEGEEACATAVYGLAEAPRSTRTTTRAGRSSRSTASSSPPPRRASAARRARPGPAHRARPRGLGYRLGGRASRRCRPGPAGW